MKIDEVKDMDPWNLAKIFDENHGIIEIEDCVCPDCRQTVGGEVEINPLGEIVRIEFDGHFKPFDGYTNDFMDLCEKSYKSVNLKDNEKN